MSVKDRRQLHANELQSAGDDARESQGFTGGGRPLKTQVALERVEAAIKFATRKASLSWPSSRVNRCAV